MLHLALLDQVLDSSRYVFNRNLVIDAMLIEQIDDIGPQALERRFGNLLNMLWTAVQPSLLAVFDVESELGRDHYIFTKWSQRLAHEFFICVGTINLRCIEERDTALHRHANKRDPLLIVHRWTIAEAQAHAAESNRRDLKIAFSKLSLFHLF